MSLKLAQPKTVQVQFQVLSGLTESGLYVLDHNDINFQDQDVSLLVRVLAKHPTCSPEIIVDRVYVCANPYNFDTVEYDDVTYCVMGENNLLAEYQNYDEDVQRITDELEAENFPVCGKA